VGAERFDDRLEVGASAAHARGDADAHAAVEQAAAGVAAVNSRGGLNQAVDRARAVVDLHTSRLHGAAGQLCRAAALADPLADVGAIGRVDRLGAAIPQRYRAGGAASVVTDDSVVVGREAGTQRRTDVPLR